MNNKEIKGWYFVHDKQTGEIDILFNNDLYKLYCKKCVEHFNNFNYKTIPNVDEVISFCQNNLNKLIFETNQSGVNALIIHTYNHQYFEKIISFLNQNDFDTYYMTNILYLAKTNFPYLFSNSLVYENNFKSKIN